MDHVLSRFRLAAAALLISALLGLAIAGPVNAGTTTDRRQGGHADIPKWWQFDKIVWQYGWWHNRTIEAHHELWHRNHPRATTYQNRKVHRWFRHEWRYSHFHKAIGWQSGDATWYDKAGSVGACGVRLEGLYAASRTLPCGSIVSVRHGDRYVIVTIEDRGPYGSSQRILDLAPSAFKQLAPLGAGVIAFAHLDQRAGVAQKREVDGAILRQRKSFCTSQSFLNPLPGGVVIPARRVVHAGINDRHGIGRLGEQRGIRAGPPSVRTDRFYLAVTPKQQLRKQDVSGEFAVERSAIVEIEHFAPTPRPVERGIVIGHVHAIFRR